MDDLYLRAIEAKAEIRTNNNRKKNQAVPRTWRRFLKRSCTGSQDMQELMPIKAQTLWGATMKIQKNTLLKRMHRILGPIVCGKVK